MEMTYYTLGNSGLKVPRLALGTMTFGTEWGWGADREVARAIFDTYVDAGGNFFDTADAYTGGTSEKWLGAFINERGMRDDAVIATKFSMNLEANNPNAAGNGRKNMLRAVEGSLKRLNTDYVDLFLLHCWDRLTPPEEVMRTFDELIRSGKVRYVGLSDVPAWYASRAQTIAEHRGYEPLAALQLEYSLAERHIENEFVPFGTRYGTGIMAWSPLASGLLSGKYRADTNEGVEGRLEVVRGTGNPGFQKFTERNWPIVEELQRVSAEIGRSMAQVAVNWVMAQPGIASVIIGARTQQQLTDNLGALLFEIPSELKERLDQVSALHPTFPYSFFGPEIQGSLTGSRTVADKPAGYFPDLEMSAKFAGVS
jgi:aryl-alcohol dehydrogenase-like predicted oxidoreductase